MSKLVNNKSGTPMGGTMVYASKNRVKCDCNNCCNWDVKRKYCNYYCKFEMRKTCARYDPIKEPKIPKVSTAKFVVVTKSGETYRGLKYKSKVFMEDNKTVKVFRGGKVEVVDNPEWATRELLAMQSYFNSKVF